MNTTPLYSAAAISERISGIADALNRDFGRAPVVHAIVTLNGAFIFAADLIRQLKFPLVLHFAGGSFFEGTEKRSLLINPDALPTSFGNNPVLLIEDVMDSGNTVGQLRKMVAERFSGTIRTVALLKRQSGDGDADYFGFTLPRGLYVVGYGMDMDGRYRELPDIRTLSAGMPTDDVGIC